MLKRFLTSLLASVLILIGLASPAVAAEKRVALVIGNAKYRDAPLGNPLNDARDMANMLRQTGFEVIELIDGTQKEMNRAIAKFSDRLSKDAVALFYYAGHGMQVRGKNYLIPVDAKITNQTSIRVESVDVDGVLDQLASSELNVIILDACRNNPFEGRFRSLGGGLAQMDAPKGSLIAYATAPGKTAVDGDGRNGLFTQELLKQMQVPGLTIEQVFKNVRREVARATRDKQIPWESSSLTSDFYFVPATPPAAAAKPSVADAVEEQVIRTDSFTVTGKVVLDTVTGAMTGEGRIAWLNGDRYEGTLVNGKKQGRGSFTWANGQRYDGEWSEDRINGVGTLHYTNGDRYEGEFRNGQPHGKGTYTLHNGDVYVGAWLNGNKHGQGRLTWVGGDYWEGEFRDDRQTDNGRLVYGDGVGAAEQAVEQAPVGKAAKPAVQKKAK
ncbi:hypothetical protein AT959_01235 [Dechloromonas denitrificans]|uniref:Caspase family p20 domain-containing protein n=1 Tax=Dechloromonas denitrificans TaxID=281362 RepID=A0A133XN36_9RHOO|nr:caspase family protein [Dechloromonas denitrificans]KXB32350.1 hypothetical protein AT959_01235 [Dechloromonas denitrificans]